jgi:uncharacterized protein (DUF433 family)
MSGTGFGRAANAVNAQLRRELLPQFLRVLMVGLSHIFEFSVSQCSFLIYKIAAHLTIYAARRILHCIMHERISIDPLVCHGQACIKGTRLPVHQIVGMLAGGDSIEDLLRGFPSLSREDVLACLAYAAELAQEEMALLPV